MANTMESCELNWRLIGDCGNFQLVPAYSHLLYRNPARDLSLIVLYILSVCFAGYLSLQVTHSMLAFDVLCLFANPLYV